MACLQLLQTSLVIITLFLVNPSFSGGLKKMSLEEGAGDGDEAVDAESSFTLFNFKEIDSLEDWSEISDTVRKVGKSKASFVIQKTQEFQRAVFFVLLNPQPNGAGFAGFRFIDRWDLSGYDGVSIFLRAQGGQANETLHYKFVLHHNGLNSEPHPSYECFYEAPRDFKEVKLPFSSFQPYFRGKIVPDALLLNTSHISSVENQIPGGVYSDFKQSGPYTAEIDYIRVYKN